MSILKKLGLVLLIWFTIHSVYIVIDGLTDNGASADVAVVMGSRVNRNGILSERLQARVDCAYDLYKAGRVKCILVSGGHGETGYDEAEIMKTHLMSKGVPSHAIFVDNMGNNTRSTVKNSILPAAQNGWNSFMVVTQYFHVTRSKMLYRRECYQRIEGVGAKYFEWRDFYSIFREFWAFYVNLL
jgi:vancomycin permeability regulator SanA